MSSKPKILASDHLETDDLKSIDTKLFQTVLSGLGISKKHIKDYIFELKGRQLGMISSAIEESSLHDECDAMREACKIRTFLEEVLSFYSDDDQHDDRYDFPDLEPGLMPVEPERQREKQMPPFPLFPNTTISPRKKKDEENRWN